VSGASEAGDESDGVYHG
jgi:transposase